MIKRLISVAVTIAMLLCIQVSASSIYSQQELDDYSERVRMLEAFKVMDGADRQDISATITRGDFSELVARLMGYEGVASGKPSFDDLDPKSNEAKAIEAITKLGYLSGYSDGTFRPDELITYEQAIKVFVSMLGYERLALSGGGYPIGYINTAQGLGLISKVEGYMGYPITYDNLTKMIVNSLDVDFMMKTATGAEEGYSIVEGRNILAYNMKLEKRRGIVLANEYTSLMESAKCGKDSLNIDGVVYKTIGNYNHLLGCNIDFYVNNDDSSDEVITFVKSPNKLNDILTINEENLESYRDRTYEYYENKGDTKTKKADVLAGAYVIINGKVASSYTDEEMYPASGTVKLIDNNKDGDYDVVNIVRYEHYIVSQVDASKNKVYDMFNTSRVLNLDKSVSSGNLSIYDTDGKRVNPEGLKEWDVLSVSQSQDLEITNIVVSRKQIEGSITEIDNGQDLLVTIADKQYEVLDSLESPVELDIDKFGTFYLNKDGKIIAFKLKNALDSGYGYLMAEPQSTNRGVDKRVEVKLLDTENNIRILKTAKKIKVDKNDGLKETNDILGKIKNGTGISKLIKFRLNADGEISEIDTAFNAADPEGFRIIYDNQEGSGPMYRGNHYTFEGKVNINSKTVMFKVPKDILNADDEDYSVIHTNYFKHDFNYPITAFSSSGYTLIADALVTYEKADSTDPKVGAVSRIYKAVEQDGTSVTKIELETYIGKEVLFTDDETMLTQIQANNNHDSSSAPSYSLEVGDLVNYNANSRGKLTSIYLLIDSSGDFKNTSSVVKFTPGHYLAMDRFYFGHVYDRQDDVIALTSKTDMATRPDDLETQKLTGYKILLFDTKSSKKKFMPASAKDIFDYKHSLGDRSDVFIFTEYADQRLMVIYK